MFQYLHTNAWYSAPIRTLFGCYEIHCIYRFSLWSIRDLFQGLIKTKLKNNILNIMQSSKIFFSTVLIYIKRSDKVLIYFYRCLNLINTTAKLFSKYFNRFLLWTMRTYKTTEFILIKVLLRTQLRYELVFAYFELFLFLYCLFCIIMSVN